MFDFYIMFVTALQVGEEGIPEPAARLQDHVALAGRKLVLEGDLYGGCILSTSYTPAVCSEF